MAELTARQIARYEQSVARSQRRRREEKVAEQKAKAAEQRSKEARKAAREKEALRPKRFRRRSYKGIRFKKISLLTRRRYGANFTVAMRSELAWRVNDPCAYCGNPSNAWDHIDALFTGGRHEVSNLTRACQPCNSAKRTASPLIFLAKRAIVLKQRNALGSLRSA